MHNKIFAAQSRGAAHAFKLIPLQRESKGLVRLMKADSLIGGVFFQFLRPAKRGAFLHKRPRLGQIFFIEGKIYAVYSCAGNYVYSFKAAVMPEQIGYAET